MEIIILAPCTRTYPWCLMPCDLTKGANVSLHTNTQNSRCKSRNKFANKFANFVHMPWAVEVTVKHDLVALKYKPV